VASKKKKKSAKSKRAPRKTSETPQAPPVNSGASETTGHVAHDETDEPAGE
jgi:hypothetical protein